MGCLELILGKLIVEIEEVEANLKNPEANVKKFGEQEKYLRSPILRSSLLYWACYYKLELSLITQLLSFSDVIPEFPNYCVGNKTSIHACCENGYTECLTLLLDKAKEQHGTNLLGIRSSLGAVEQILIKQNIKQKSKRAERGYVMLLTLTKEERRKFKKKFIKNLQNASAWYSSYVSKISHSKHEALKTNLVDSKDLLGNTPLHFASYYGHDKCALILLQMGK